MASTERRAHKRSVTRPAIRLLAVTIPHTRKQRCSRGYCVRSLAYRQRLITNARSAPDGTNGAGRASIHPPTPHGTLALHQWQEGGEGIGRGRLGSQLRYEVVVIPMRIGGGSRLKLLESASDSRAGGEYHHGGRGDSRPARWRASVAGRHAGGGGRSGQPARHRPALCATAWSSGQGLRLHQL